MPELAQTVTARQFGGSLIVASVLLVGLVVGAGCRTVKVEKMDPKAALAQNSAYAAQVPDPIVPVNRTEDEWKKLLTPEQFRVPRLDERLDFLDRNRRLLVLRLPQREDAEHLVELVERLADNRHIVNAYLPGIDG